jgi:hypothetical protein
MEKRKSYLRKVNSFLATHVSTQGDNSNSSCLQVSVVSLLWTLAVHLTSRLKSLAHSLRAHSFSRNSLGSTGSESAMAFFRCSCLGPANLGHPASPSWMVQAEKNSMSFRGGHRGGGFRGGRGGGRGGFGGGSYGGSRDDYGPPAELIRKSFSVSNPGSLPAMLLACGAFVHPCEGEMVCRATLGTQVPYFNAPVFLENKTQIGKVDEIFGPLNEYVLGWHVCVRAYFV